MFNDVAMIFNSFSLIQKVFISLFVFVAFVFCVLAIVYLLERKSSSQAKSDKLPILRQALVWTCLCAFLVYINWRILQSLPFHFGWVAISLSIVLLCFEVFDFLSMYLSAGSKIKPVSFVLPDVNEKDYPHVDVFITTYGEPFNIVERTVNGAVNIDYPDNSKLHIWLLDDKNRAEMKELAKNFGINYIARKKNVDAKAGNLNNALKQANSPYMLVLDADMVPKKCILKKMIPFFVDAENQNKNKPENEKYKLGFVQSPQSFYRSDMFQHALKLNHKVMQENNYFFRYDQAGRNEKNLVTYCGTGAVLSRAAIDEIGGFHTQALTEDLPTGLKIRDKGYNNIAISDCVVEGVPPYKYEDYIKQRTRWTFGNIGGMRQLKALKKNMTNAQVRAYHALNLYWHAPISTVFGILLPVISVLFGLIIFEVDIYSFGIIWIGYYMLRYLTFKLITDKKSSNTINRIRDFVTCFALFIPLLRDMFGMHYKKVTAAQKDSNIQTSATKLAIATCPHVVMLVLSLVSMFMVLSIGPARFMIFHFVVIFWLAYNCIFLILSLVIMWNNKPVRDGSVSRTEHDCQISVNDKRDDACVFAMSDEFVSFTYTGSINLKNNCQLQFAQDKNVKLNLTIVDVNEEYSAYTAKINPEEKKNYAYMTLLYNDLSDMQSNPDSISFVGVLLGALRVLFGAKTDKYYD